eukprot:CAMPEP_0194348954 /NCGR_PEP_ID=MMETSP0171-20130528/106820_1 /TAXON_ID=218684 /ORGANISM="Corethron pennatum, Strain L29A3" /LENGTH=677 /DNA_ID=CAMNT_0039116351 /DNA_START=268 /DNA_END=2302 /DNA_ORIENTATION=-
MKGSEVYMEEPNEKLAEMQMKVPTYSPYNLPKGSDVSIEEPKKKFAQPIASPTVLQKLTLKSVCSEDNKCVSGNCYRRSNQKIGLCQCKPCSTSGCGGCQAKKYCNLIEGKKFPRCDVYYPSSNGEPTGEPTGEPRESTGANVAVSLLPTKAQVEMRGTEPRKVESDPPVALTLSPTVFEKLDIGEHCEGMVTACLGPASDTVFQNWDFVNVKPVSVLVVEDVLLTISVMLLLHWDRTYVLCTFQRPHRSQVICLQWFQQLGVILNLDVGKFHAGAIVTAQSLMHIVMGWKYVHKRKRLVLYAKIQGNVVLAFADAYCNGMEVCAQKKEIGAVCEDSRECGFGICDRNKCRFLSDAPSSPSLAPTSDFSVVDKAKTAVVDRAKNTINTVNGALEDISWYTTLPSHMQIGLIVGLCVIALMLLSTIFWGCYVLLKLRSMPQLKEETERDDSSTLNNNSFSLLRLQSSDSSISSKEDLSRRSHNSIGSENARAHSPFWKTSNIPSKTSTKSLSEFNYPKAPQKEPLSCTSPLRSQSPASNVSSKVNIPRNVTAPSQPRPLSPAWGVPRPQSPASSVSSKVNFPRNVTAPSQSRPLSPARSMPRPQSLASSIPSKVNFSRNVTAPSQSRPLSPAWGVPRPQSPASSVSSKVNFPRHVTAPSQSRPLSPAGARYKKSGLFA